MSESDENPGMTAIRDAVQTYLNNIYDEAVVVRDVVVIVESMQLGDDGRMAHAVNYTIPTDGTSMAAATGLCRLGELQITRDVIEGGEDE